MILLALDPGTNETGWVIYDTAGKGKILDFGIDENENLRLKLREKQGLFAKCVRMAIEMVASYGKTVGATTFETCVWIGIFIEAAGLPFKKIYRQDVKLQLCMSPKAKDPQIRQALIDRFGEPGRKKNPGPTFGISSHAWAALAVAVTYADKRKERRWIRRRKERLADEAA